MKTPSEQTEALEPEQAHFPRARLEVVKGPDAGAEVVLEGEPVVVGTGPDCQLRLTDSSVSRRHLELSGGPGGWRLKDLGSTNGVHLDGVQVLEGRVLGRARLSLGRTQLRLEPERAQVTWSLSPHERFGQAVGKSLVMRRLFAVLERAARAPGAVVLEGEAGAGKDVLALSLHLESARRGGPFVAVDLGASSAALMEADLFGHDVSQGRPQARPGAFEEASGGTLYLDEVAGLTPALQGKVLRALESGQVKRPGLLGTAAVEVRVVASSRLDLEAEVRAGRFREDLFLALAVFRARVPPLRERLDDVPLLVRHLEAALGAPAPLPADGLAMLARHDWPGNVRELRQVLERLLFLPDAGAPAVAQALLGGPEAGRRPRGGKEAEGLGEALLGLPYHEAKERVHESFERRYLVEHLRAAGGVVAKAARRTGLPRQSLHRMLKRLGVSSRDE